MSDIKMNHRLVPRYERE